MFAKFKYKAYFINSQYVKPVSFRKMKSKNDYKCPK